MINHTILAISAFIIGLVCSVAGGVLAIDILGAAGFVMFFITALALLLAPDVYGEGL